MADLQKYWNDVRAQMASLDRQQIYYLMSQDNQEKGTVAGRVMDLADQKMVARRLVERTHRLATPEEIAQYKAEQAKAVEDLATIEMDRKGQLAMPKELQDLVRLAVAGAEKKKEKS